MVASLLGIKSPEKRREERVVHAQVLQYKSPATARTSLRLLAGVLMLAGLRVAMSSAENRAYGLGNNGAVSGSEQLSSCCPGARPGSPSPSSRAAR